MKLTGYYLHMWQQLQPDEIGLVNEIADAIHPGLPERPEVFEEKYNLFPRGCMGYMHRGKLAGYGISHPWRLFSIPPLDDFLTKLPDMPDCVYVHDVALLSEARGHDAANQYILIVKQLARSLGISSMACVSVYGTDRLWARCGFSTLKGQDIEDKLKTYGSSAKYMRMSF